MCHSFLLTQLPSKSRERKKAFTLIELSIVLAVIGLIAASVVSGKALVRQAQLLSIIAEARSYDTAITNFKGLYGQLPGDFTDAYSYWGSTCASDATSCNGNNDGQIDIGNPRQELFMAFLHLNLAGLIPGAYTGFSSATNYSSEAGKNIPAGKFPNSEWIVGTTQGTWYAANINNAIVTKNVFQIGKHFTDSINEGSLFTPTEVLLPYTIALYKFFHIMKSPCRRFLCFMRHFRRIFLSLVPC